MCIPREVDSMKIWTIAEMVVRTVFGAVPDVEDKANEADGDTSKTGEAKKNLIIGVVRSLLVDVCGLNGAKIDRWLAFAGHLVDMAVAFFNAISWKKPAAE